MTSTVSTIKFNMIGNPRREMIVSSLVTLKAFMELVQPLFGSVLLSQQNLNCPLTMNLFSCVTLRLEKECPAQWLWLNLQAILEKKDETSIATVGRNFLVFGRIFLAYILVETVTNKTAFNLAEFGTQNWSKRSFPISQCQHHLGLTVLKPTHAGAIDPLGLKSFMAVTFEKPQAALDNGQ